MKRAGARVALTALTALTLLLVGCDAAPGSGYRVVAKYPHDRNAYTQGLLFHDGYLYESTGLNGRSSLRQVDPETGVVLRRRDLNRQFFGEGLARVGDRLIQLTWRSGVAIVYDAASFEPLRLHRYDTQGWGLTYDGRQLIMSDGSATLYFRDPDTFEVLGTITVSEDGRPLRHLNELEMVDGEVWANVYQTDRVVRIDPASGRVLGALDFSDLLGADDRYGGEDVLNGIAYDATGGRLFVTGKLYAYLYQIEID